MSNEREERLRQWLTDADDLYSASCWAEQIDADVLANHREIARLRLLVEQLLTARRLSPTSPPSYIWLEMPHNSGVKSHWVSRYTIEAITPHADGQWSIEFKHHNYIVTNGAEIGKLLHLEITPPSAEGGAE